MEYTHGMGELPEALESALVGQGIGHTATVAMGPGEAFGDKNLEGIVSVPRTDLPPEMELVPGQWIEVMVEDEDNEGESGSLEMRVVELAPDAVVLDANHPLAGLAVTFEVKVLEIEPGS